MPRKVYNEATKSAFMQAVIAARAANRPWVDAFKAAQAAGYTGTLGGIERMFREMRGKKRGPKPKAKRGRPKGSKSVLKRGGRFYNDAAKAAIVNAAREARLAGKKWPQALAAAKAVGYRGGVISLIGFVTRAGQAVKKPGRPGRPRKQEANGIGPIQEIIGRLVKERVKAALDRAIEELQKVRG